MKKRYSLAIGTIFILGFFSVVSAVPSPCGKSGMTALRADDGRGFIFFAYREGPDVYFAIEGKEISFPDGTKGPKRFFVDDILFETIFVKLSDFMKPDKTLADLEVLKKHREYEFDYIVKTPTVMRKLDELGPRVKNGSNGQPSFTFYLWAILDPKNETGARQYFLTTVSGGEVAVLTAIVRDQSAEDGAMRAFESYASSFRHVLKKEDCPEK